MRAALALGLLVSLAGTAVAGPDGEVASAFDHGDHFDLHAGLDYDVSFRSSRLEREDVARPGVGRDDSLPLAPDLRFASARQTLTPHLAVGFFTDLSLSLALPIVLSDTRRLERDAGVTATGSSTLTDGLLPASGFDAEAPTGPGFTDGTVFRGVTRRGLDQLHLGLEWAPMNQARDATKPTWKLGAELAFAVGRPMRFSRRAPASETGVSRGVHELRLWTSVTKRTRWAEPFVELWWQAAIGQRATSPWNDLKREFGAARTSPMQRAGSRFGFEAIAWERPEDDTRVSVDLAGAVDAHFEGRDYSDLWEVFAYAGDAAAGGPLVLDGDPVTAGIQALSHPGISNIENYLVLSGRLGVEGHLGPRARLGAHFTYAFEQSHLVTFADAGRDRPTCAGGQTAGCETDNNEVVNPGTPEVNPLYVPLIDVTGHRYRVTGGRDYTITIDARLLF